MPNKQNFDYDKLRQELQDSWTYRDSYRFVSEKIGIPIDVLYRFVKKGTIIDSDTFDKITNYLKNVSTKQR